MLTAGRWGREIFRVEVLMWVLQLASRMLESYDSRQYLYAAILSPLFNLDLADEAGMTRTRRAIFRNGAPLTADEEVRIDATSFALLDLVTFSVTPLKYEEEGLCAPRTQSTLSVLRQQRG